MEYMLMLGVDAEAWLALSQKQRQAIPPRIADWVAQLTRSGRLRDRRELHPPSAAKTVRARGRRSLVTDGPFVESKEVIGGYVVVDVADIDAAVEVARSWPMPHSVVEVRPVVAS